jgi:hypothetical protein
MKRRDRPPGGRANRLRASAKLDVHFPPNTGAGQPINDVGQGQEGDLAGTAAIGAKQPFVGIDKGRGPARYLGRVANYSSLCALGLAFFVSHVVLLRAAIRGAKGSLGRSDDISSFAQAFDRVSDRLERNAVVRHGWRQFAATTIRESTSVRYTVRPQSFINLADARGELFGLSPYPGILWVSGCC